MFMAPFYLHTVPPDTQGYLMESWGESYFIKSSFYLSNTSMCRVLSRAWWDESFQGCALQVVYELAKG